jgi:hypothetical protein
VIRRADHEDLPYVIRPARRFTHMPVTVRTVDRAGQFIASFDEILADACIKAVKIPSRSPHANAMRKGSWSPPCLPTRPGVLEACTQEGC